MFDPGGWIALPGHVVVRRPEVRAIDRLRGPVDDPGGLFDPPIVRGYPTVQRVTGDGFADHPGARPDVREPLLDAIAEPSARGWTTARRVAT